MYSLFPETGDSVLLSGKADKTDQNMMNVSCESAGWYPKPNLQWYKQEKAVTPKSLEYSTDSSGLESVHSWLLVPSSFDISCSVGLPGEEPKRGRLRLDNSPAPGKDKYCCVCNPFIVSVLIHTEIMCYLCYVESKPSAGWVSFFVLLIIVAVAALITALYWKKRTKPYSKSESVKLKPVISFS